MRVNDNSLYFEENMANPSLYLNKSERDNDIIPKKIQSKWYASRDEVCINEDEILVNKEPFILDFFAVSNTDSFLVGYNNGNYSLFKIEKDSEEVFLYYSNHKYKKETLFQKYVIVFIILAIIIALILVYLLFKWKVALSKKKEETKRKFAETQLKSIRSQMNPHFLFNALSAIQNLINKNENERANHYLTEFSQLMRLTLDKSEKGLVPLSDEIASIEKYLELENLRFKFNYNIKTDSKINASQVEIPAMLVQPFVENAIIHGINEIEGDKYLSVEFKLEEDYLLCLA